MVDLRHSAVFLWSDQALFLGDRSQTAVHAHNAIEVSIALDDRGLEVSTPQGPSVTGAGAVVVRSDAPHRLSIPGPKVAVLYVEPRSPFGAGLGAWLGDRLLAPMPAAGGALREAFAALFRRDHGLVEASRACDGLLARLVPDPPRGAIDARVRRAMAFAQARLDAPPGQAEVAAAVGLSASRLGHLFTAQVGVPLRRWILWMRLRAALTAALGGASMTEAAFAAGFSDAAHFTRTCQRMFGLAPTAFAPVEELLVGP